MIYPTDKREFFWIITQYLQFVITPEKITLLEFLQQTEIDIAQIGQIIEIALVSDRLELKYFLLP